MHTLMAMNNALLVKIFQFLVIVVLFLLCWCLRKSSSPYFLNQDTSVHASNKIREDIFQTFVYSKKTYKNVTMKQQVSVLMKENVDIPSEVYDKKSPFYGMIYKNIYGLPVTAFANQSFEEVTDCWREYFPSLMSTIEEDLKKNPNQSARFFTKSGLITLFKTTYTLGEELEATIVSVYGDGKPKTYGGDYYRARLIRDDENYPDGIPCRVVDNHDGTYTVKAPLVLEGPLILDVKLVHILHGIKRIADITAASICSNVTKYKATLKSKETVNCASHAKCLKDTSYCDYSIPWNKAKWICEKPPSGKCSEIINIVSDYNKNKERKVWKAVCRTYGCDIKLPRLQIEVKKPQLFHFSLNQDLPKCHEMFAKNELNRSVSVTGYFEQHQWKSLVCQNYNGLQPGLQSFQTCLKNKVIYMLGDSTIREIFLLASKSFSLKVIESSASNVWQQPRVANGPLHNLTLYYRAHGPPMKSPGPPFSRPFIADSISNILVGGRDVCVVFTIGIHFHEINPILLMSRLKQIHGAILHHHKIFSETKFIIKGINAVEPADFWDWTLFRYEIILRKYFKGLRNVLFVNLWDLTTVWPLLEDVHAPARTLDQEVILLFSYMCER